MSQNKQKHLNIITLGCSKNLVDSEKIAGKLLPGQFKITHNANGLSDVVIINTCGFIHDAKEESIDTILHYLDGKKRGLVDEVIVTGCLSERYKEELLKEIPEADAWFGVHDTNEIFSFLRAKYNADDGLRQLSTPDHYAYLKISEGCDRTCSFCAIPLIRGRYHSQSVSELTREARLLASKGVKELMLIAQDLSYYGYDLRKKGLLVELLDSLLTIDQIEWIRLHYAYPDHFPLQILDMMNETDKICRYLDMPLQHINDAILKGMRRGSTGKEIYKLIETIRTKVPDVALRSTLMVGFPGETKQQFEELLRFVREVQFDRLGVFTYSAEEGTRAFHMKETVSEQEKQDRADQIMEEQQNISLALNQKKTGLTMKVLIDEKDEDYYHGRTQYDSPEVDNEVLIPVHKYDLTPGMFYKAKIISASEFDLYAEIEGN